MGADFPMGVMMQTRNFVAGKFLAVWAGGFIA
jgi:hypothetical protein